MFSKNKRPISQYIETDPESPTTEEIHCTCKNESFLFPSEFCVGTSDLHDNVRGRVLAVVRCGLVVHAFTSLLFECTHCLNERRILCEFGPDETNPPREISYWELANVNYPRTTECLHHIKGLPLREVKNAFEETKRKFKEYHLLTSNCQHWVADFRERVERLLPPS